MARSFDDEDYSFEEDLYGNPGKVFRTGIYVSPKRKKARKRAKVSKPALTMKPRDPEAKDELWKMIQKRWSVKSIAKEFSVSDATVRSALRHHGLPTPTEYKEYLRYKVAGQRQEQQRQSRTISETQLRDMQRKKNRRPLRKNFFWGKKKDKYEARGFGDPKMFRGVSDIKQVYRYTQPYMGKQSDWESAYGYGQDIIKKTKNIYGRESAGIAPYALIFVHTADGDLKLLDWDTGEHKTLADFKREI
jgi:hypothetical protein